jgi:hypothetical protein
MFPCSCRLSLDDIRSRDLFESDAVECCRNCRIFVDHSIKLPLVLTSDEENFRGCEGKFRVYQDLPGRLRVYDPWKQAFRDTCSTPRTRDECLTLGELVC